MTNYDISTMITASGRCGEHVIYEIVNDSILWISGEGPMQQYSDSIRPDWEEKYKDKIVTVVIEEQVTSVGKEAFQGCSELSFVFLADSVKTIEERAFYQCRSLGDITLPDELRWIGTEAFAGCRELESLELPDGLTHIGDKAFAGCRNLSDISLEKLAPGVEVERIFQGISKRGVMYVPASRQRYYKEILCHLAAFRLYGWSLQTA